jgi:hypothetical protein
MTFRNGEVICDAPGEKPGERCGNVAIRYGQDMKYRSVDLCDRCSCLWYIAVCAHKMPMPKMQCSTCGKEAVLSCAEYSKTMGFLDNRMGKRPKNPIYVCSSCSNPLPLGWATLSNGKVLFAWIEDKKEEAVA